MTIQTIPDPSAPCTGVKFPRLCKRFCNKQKRRKRPHLIAKYGMQCFWCKVALTPETLTIDHYIPLSRGGTNKIKNLRLSCHACNNQRGNSLPGEVKQ